MNLTIKLAAGPNHREIVTAADIQKNIDALDRYFNCVPRGGDAMLLMDTKSILEAIQKQLLRASAKG